MKLKAELYRVVVEKQPVEETSKGGIVLHSTDRQKRIESAALQIVTIVDIGPTACRDAKGTLMSELKVGDKVMLAKFAGAFGAEDPMKPIVGVVNDEDIICQVIDEDTTDAR